MPSQGPGTPATDRTDVLVVEDDPGLAADYVGWLDRRWSVEHASGGRAALAALDAEPRVAVIDRQLSAVHGDRLLGVVRERGLDSRVAMLTAVEPGVDAERLGFDAHLVKPVARERLLATVEELLLRAAYDEHLDEFYALAARRADLESRHSPEALEASEEYRSVRSRLSAVRSAVEEVHAAFDEDGDYGRLYAELSAADAVGAPPRR